MNSHKYIENMKTIQNILVSFLDNQSSFDNLNKAILTKIINSQNLESKQEFKSFLYLLSNVAQYHFQGQHFFKRVKQIIDYYKGYIKKYYSNSEILNIFKDNKRILLYLHKKGIIKIHKELFEKLGLNNFKKESHENITVSEYTKRIISEIDAKKHSNIDYEIFFYDAIRDHHNDIAKYVKDNFLQNESKSMINEGLQFYNFEYIQYDDLKKASLLELVKYEYYILVNDFIKMPDIDINKVIYHKVFYYMIYNFI